MEQVRKAVQGAVPEAKETISYNMPAFRFHGILIYYAAFKEHIGFYPGNATLIPRFSKELAGYETSKGTIRFPLDRELPVELIRTLAKLRAEENLGKKRRS
jgi:uncharacterized protein YdhG (YjbR/CyaY superfamily)